MAKITDLCGRRYGKLTVVGRAGKTRDGRSLWQCHCACGKTTTVRQHDLVRGKSGSCGCRQNRGSLPRHGHKLGGVPSPEYRVWLGIIQRTTNPKAQAYKDYGARGIDVCSRWLKFDNFIADVGLRPSTNHTIERKDNDKGYFPSNVRWATRSEQARNRRSSRRISFDGLTLTLVDWSERVGINAGAIHDRLARGWSPRKALTTPVQKRVTVVIDGVTWFAKDLARSTGAPYTTIMAMIRDRRPIALTADGKLLLSRKSPHQR